MPIFYLLHNIIHNVLNLDKSDGQKNCITFLLGTIIWIVFWVILFYFRKSFIYDACRTGFFVILLADCIVLAYLYKTYYGRFIFNEIGEDPSTTSWKFDEETKKYRKKDEIDQMEEEFEKMRRYKEFIMKKDKDLVNNSVIKIQRFFQNR